MLNTIHLKDKKENVQQNTLTDAPRYHITKIHRMWRTTKEGGLARTAACYLEYTHAHIYTWDRLAFPGAGKQPITQD